MESLEYQKKLSTEEWAIFTKLMSSNSDFAEDMAFEIELRETLDTMNQYDLVKDVPKSPQIEMDGVENKMTTNLPHKPWTLYWALLALLLLVGGSFWFYSLKKENILPPNQPKGVLPDTPSVFRPILLKDTLKKDTPIVLNSPLKDKKQNNIPIDKKPMIVLNDSLRFAEWVDKNKDTWETAGVNEFYKFMQDAQYNEALAIGLQLFKDNKVKNNPRMAYVIGVLSLLKKNDVEQAVKFFEIANQDATYQDIAQEYYELALSRQKKK